MNNTPSKSSIRPITLDSQLSEQGDVYNVRAGKILGWYKSTNDSSSPNEIVLQINGSEQTTTIVNKACTVRNGKDNETHPLAFEFDISHLPKCEVYKFTFFNKKTGYTFDDREIHFCSLVNKFRAEIREIFFPEYYKNTQKLWGYTNREAFNHYISVGLYHDLPPNPWFSPSYYRKYYGHKMGTITVPILSYINFEKDLNVQASPRFCPKQYLLKNNGIGESLTILGHYVNEGHVQGLYPDESQLPSQILKELDVLSEIEPELKDFVVQKKPVTHYPLLSRSTFLASFLKKSYPEGFEIIVCVPYLSCGGADLISLFTLKAYQNRFGIDKVLLLVTDRSENTVPDWLEPKTKVIFLDDETKFSSFDERVQTLHTIVGALCPKAIVNINSHAAWSLFENYGRQLSSVINLIAYLFCFDYDHHKAKVGYIVRYLPSTIKYLKLVIFDNKKIINDINYMFGFPQKDTNKLNTAYVPLPKEIKTTESHGADREPTNKILWTGRLARQKRPEILLSIAMAMPNYTFVVYGPKGNAEHSNEISSNLYSNIEYRGVYSRLDELNVSEFDLFVNTSEWDGLPTVLIQMMGLGLPIVTSNVGGIHELVTDETGWLVDDHDDFNAYVLQIKKSLINKKETYMRVSNGVALVEKRHSWDEFNTRLEKLDAYNIEKTGIPSKIRKFERRRAV